MMTTAPCQIVLIGFESQENLGMRSLASYLKNKGISTSILSMHNSTNDYILEQIRMHAPVVVGFSLIFQRMLGMFTELIGFLRDKGIASHFTMGGHFPTFEYEHVLNRISGLNTVIRFEGEETLLELYQCIYAPEKWHQIQGLAYKSDKGIIVTSPRPLIKELDSLLPPVRSNSSTDHRGLGIRSISGSRGCYHNCSFCSISVFYSLAEGRKRRSRSPKNVVEEMKVLYHTYHTRIFIFQDDDFLMNTAKQLLWISNFLEELSIAGLSDHIVWRISCRVDDLNEDMLLKMKESGLASVYLGIESASDEELGHMNKGYGKKEVYEAVNMLKKISIPFEFGFMMLTPDSTLESIRENLEFLKHISSEHFALINFCKMSPYAGTPVQRRLIRENRLEGSVECPDYRFLDPKLDYLQLFLNQAFNYRNFNDNGLVERLRFAKFDLIILQHFYGDDYPVERYRSDLEHLVRKANDQAIDSIEFAWTFLAKNSEDDIIHNWFLIEDLIKQEMESQQLLTSELDDLQIESNQGEPLEADTNLTFFE